MSVRRYSLGLTKTHALDSVCKTPRTWESQETKDTHC